MPPVDSGPAIPTARTELADLIAESAGGCPTANARCWN